MRCAPLSVRLTEHNLARYATLIFRSASMGSPSWETDREQLAGQRVIESSTKRKMIQPPRLCVARRLVRPPADGAASASCCGACELDEAVCGAVQDR